MDEGCKGEGSEKRMETDEWGRGSGVYGNWMQKEVPYNDGNGIIITIWRNKERRRVSVMMMARIIKELVAVVDVGRSDGRWNNDGPLWAAS